MHTPASLWCPKPSGLSWPLVPLACIVPGKVQMQPYVNPFSLMSLSGFAFMIGWIRLDDVRLVWPCNGASQ